MMNFLTRFGTVLLFISAPSLFAMEKSSNLDNLATDHYVGQFLLKKDSQSILEGPVCHPSSGNCIDAACRYLPSYLCDDLDELNQIGNACRGNYGGECLNTACSKLPSYLCDDLNEIIAVANACKGNWGNCLARVCSYLPSYLCDDLSEITELATACQNAEGSCIDSVCSRLPSYQCDEISELKRIASSCSGN